MTRTLWTSCALFALAACGGSSVGHPCTVDTDCDKAQICLTAAPGGYCTKGCSIEGDVKACPGGTICAQQVSGLYCSKECGSQGDCRDNYLCTPVEQSSKQACRSAQP